MSIETDQTPDLAAGVDIAAFATTPLLAGTFHGEDVLLVRTASGIRAVGAKCTHNGADLAKGLVVGETIRCPWHHACFDTRSGEALAAPAFRPLGTWAVFERDGKVFVGQRDAPHASPAPAEGERIVIVGAGAAGAAAADALARRGHAARTVLIGNEADAPYDRTMLTKHFLSGQAGEDKLPLPMEDLGTRGIDLRLSTIVTSIDPKAKELGLADGSALTYGKLILATGAEPRRLDVPGAELPHVHTLRSADDARAILDASAVSRRIVVVGGSFIGLEAAAALRDRGLDVTVVTPDPHPFAETFGAALGERILAVHRQRGTTLRLGRSVKRIEPGHVELDDGEKLAADLVVVGVGVSPRVSLAERAGLSLQDGVVVDKMLRSSDPDIFAVGDIARWPDPHSGRSIRVEHWAVAQRQGQIAAANAIGQDLSFDAVPFFWTLHFDFSARYVGHATSDHTSTVEGDLAAKDAAVVFQQAGRDSAVITVERDRQGLDAELAMELRLGHKANMLSPT